MDIEIMVEKYNNCVNALDAEKTCLSCKHQSCEASQLPCSNCYNELIGMPVNPTNWEKA